MIEATGTRLAYRVWGSPGAPPLVLLHGLGEGAADWDGVAPAFAQRRRVYAPDLRGHGRSDRPGDYSAELMAADVLGFLDALALGRVDLIGHSMGGLVGYLLAGDHPERVRRLILEDVAALRPRERGAPDRPEGELPFDWAMVLAIRRQIDPPTRPGSDGSAGSPRRPWSSRRPSQPRPPGLGGRPGEGHPGCPDGDHKGRPLHPRHRTGGVHAIGADIPRACYRTAVGGRAHSGDGVDGIDPEGAAAAVADALRAVGTPDRAAQEKRYLKSELEFFGVTVPELRRVVRAAVRGYPGLDEAGMVAWAVALWRAPVHERRMAAAEILKLAAPRLGADDLADGRAAAARVGHLGAGGRAGGQRGGRDRAPRSAVVAGH